MKLAVFVMGFVIAVGMPASHAATVQLTPCGFGQSACFSAGHLKLLPVGMAKSGQLSILGGNGWDEGGRAVAVDTSKSKKPRATSKKPPAKSKKAIAAAASSKVNKTKPAAKKSAKSPARADTGKVVVKLSQSGLLGTAIAEQFAKSLSPVPKSPSGTSDTVSPTPIVAWVPDLDYDRKDHPESNVVPIPPAAALFLTGFGMLVAWSRRRKIVA